MALVTRNCLRILMALLATAGYAGLVNTHPAQGAGPGAPRRPSSVKLPAIPRHYPHIRIGALAYEGFRFTPFEDRLLRESVDLVIPHPTFLKHINEVAPRTPQLVYTNTSNLYLELLLDWLRYADATGVSREEAFYHVKHALPFKGDSPSSKPVTWFWGVYRGGDTMVDLTDAACGRSPRDVRFASNGGSVIIGYPDRFREINLDLSAGAADGWSAVLEYVAQVDSHGTPSRWAPLKPAKDMTRNWTRPGQLIFDPPADWKPATIKRPGLLYYVRIRTTMDGTAPAAGTILGRDFVKASGTTMGIIPAFDSQADVNHDGYLDDDEYEKRAPGKDARFIHESRMVTASYGQMRFTTNPASVPLCKWAVAYHNQHSKQYPLASGFFMDNVNGTPPVKATDVIESVANYGEASGKLVRQVAQGLAPRWVLMNVGNQGKQADPLIRANPIYFAEFAIRPLAHHYAFFEDLAGTIAHYSTLTSPAPYAVLDSFPHGGSPTDARTQLATLAYYYLLASPESTFLMYYGGSEPATPWVRHWCPATAHDVGKPTAPWSLWAKGTDPSNVALQYRVYQRTYSKALVLYKPLSFGGWRGPQPTTRDDTATKHQLPGTYQPLLADNSLGEPITSISLRNGEGAILVKANK